MMMKTMMLLVIASVCVSAAPAEVTKRPLLESIFDAVTNAMKHLPKEIFLPDLKVDHHLNCTNEFLCQTLTELKWVVSGHSGAKFEPFRTDNDLIRNLNVFNIHHHNKTCPLADNKDKIQLSAFLEDLKKCLQMKIRNTK